jgi:hypothetical protein
VLARLTSALRNQLVWSTLSYLDFEKTGAGENDLSEVIDELIINIPDAKVIVLIYDMVEADNTNEQKLISKALIYSIRNINSLSLVKEYKPIGTKSIAQIKLEKSVQEAEKEIIDAIKEKLEKLPL